MPLSLRSSLLALALVACVPIKPGIASVQVYAAPSVPR